MTGRRGSMTGGEGRVNTGCVASVRAGRQGPCSHRKVIQHCGSTWRRGGFGLHV